MNYPAATLHVAVSVPGCRIRLSIPPEQVGDYKVETLREMDAAGWRALVAKHPEWVRQTEEVANG